MTPEGGSTERVRLDIPSEERFATCGDRPMLIQWHINRHFFYTFEVETDEAEKIVPERLQVVEIRPGVALMSVGALRYQAGHFTPDSPEFNEIVAAIHVAPDLSTDMPVPTMTFFAFQVLSDSADFVAQEGHTLYTPTRHTPGLTFDLPEDELGVHVYDDEGPLITVENVLENPTYSLKEMWGQHYTFTRGPHHGIWQWDGMVVEHMRSDRNWKLFDHSVWLGLDVSRVRRCYRQMMLQPGTLCWERFYTMRPMAE